MNRSRPSLRRRRLLLAAGLLGLLVHQARAEEILPFTELQVGMNGVGRTVWSGQRVEEFKVEIVGLLENVFPQRNLILARCSGGPIADAGIAQGMSGSPVYIKGKLIGALAYTWGFAKEPIAGITPIEEMERATGEGRPPFPTASAAPAPVALLFSPDALLQFFPSLLQRSSLVPTRGGSLRAIAPRRRERRGSAARGRRPQPDGHRNGDPRGRRPRAGVRAPVPQYRHHRHDHDGGKRASGAAVAPVQFQAGIAGGRHRDGASRSQHGFAGHAG
jgi:hypothetical protein